MRVVYGGKAMRRLDLWQGLIDLRIAAPGLTQEEFMGQLVKFPPGQVPVLIDLLQFLELAPEDEQLRVDQIAKIRERLDKELEEQVEAKFASIVQFLPHPESDDNKARFKRSEDGNLLAEGGHTHEQTDSEDDWTIRATDYAASGPTLEEAAVLNAAMLAREKGYDRLLIQSRRTFSRQTHLTTSYGYYSSSSIQNSGREAGMRVRLVRSDAVPADLVGAEWRMLDVDMVIADLLPRFTD
jgi:hypothetical protein